MPCQFLIDTMVWHTIAGEGEKCNVMVDTQKIGLTGHGVVDDMSKRLDALEAALQQDADTRDSREGKGSPVKKKD